LNNEQVVKYSLSPALRK